MSIVVFILIALYFMTIWTLSKKCGHKGWQMFIPFYNLYLFYNDVFAKKSRILFVFSCIGFGISICSSPFVFVIGIISSIFSTASAATSTFGRSSGVAGAGVVAAIISIVIGLIVFLIYAFEIFAIVIWCIAVYKLARKMGRSKAFAWGALLLGEVFLPILAFSDSVYEDGSKANTEVEFVSTVVDKLRAFVSDHKAEKERAAAQAAASEERIYAQIPEDVQA